MTKSERESNGEFVLRWKRVGPLLAEFRDKELAQMKDEDRVFAIECVLSIPALHRSPRRTSGLVELQKLLAPQRS